jgi:hypothetical protein
MTAPPELLDADAYVAPPLEADIVMKGGITSGIVYPHAVCQIARRYRFRSVGGTSAGAIAAAAAGAAEHGRDTPGGGFGRLAALPDELAAVDAGGQTRLLTLFQPDPGTRRLFAVALTFLRRGRLRGALAAPRAYPLPAAISLALVLAVAALVLVTPLSAWALVAAVLAGLIVTVTGTGYELYRDARAQLPRNGFGLCRLGPEAVGPGAALTDWLHGTLQELAGLRREAPLTFGDLWGVPPAGSDRGDREALLRERERDSDKREIDLEMITTDLTHGLPLRLPIPLDEHEDRLADEGGRLLIDLEEFGRYFPQPVVEHLAEHARLPGSEVAGDLARLAPGRAFVHLPSGELPVLVAVRMSLSFPGLISAVPLYRLRYGQGGDEPLLERVVFSDGGITSNFPVHFFDRALPRRPTFALDLTGFGPDRDEEVRDPDPPGAANPWQPWAEISTLPDFLVAIKDAMQNWRDNAQARLPGFRDRVIHIHMGRGEGGLNLAMDEEKIASLTSRGSRAGARLVELFSGDPDSPPVPTDQWNDSRFVRYRIAMRGIERFLRAYSGSYRAPPDAATIGYPERVAAGMDPPYPFGSAALLGFATETTAAYLDLVDEWAREELSLSDPNTPKPPADLRMSPQR